MSDEPLDCCDYCGASINADGQCSRPCSRPLDFDQNCEILLAVYDELMRQERECETQNSSAYFHGLGIITDRY